ncbi:hypothetical protein C8D87_1021041 [Lentzea atacamensis]|uniref:Uncharacterized protein n=1 Tax=Lentzea atacamensis TaxID=531938 RepID=A0ABX9EHS1_9PSEU|nr:hypothetical protein [Lentzea atacamensis]RAS68963.1 hypothetical protein C8D87_1021041 [Lentzea atacamensis]
MEAARRSLAHLIGERWQYIGRAAGLVWAGFGPSRVVADHNGKTREVAEYALHVQRPWRVLDGISSSPGRTTSTNRDRAGPATVSSTGTCRAPTGPTREPGS